MITSIIIRNLEDIDEMQKQIIGLIGRGLSGTQFEGLVIRDVKWIVPIFHRYDDSFDILVQVVLRKETE